MAKKHLLYAIFCAAISGFTGYSAISCLNEGIENKSMRKADEKRYDISDNYIYVSRGKTKFDVTGRSAASLAGVFGVLALYYTGKAREEEPAEKPKEE